jgi:hypothetical protein
VGRDRLLVPPSVASNLRILTDLVNKYAANGRTFVVAPYWPGAYAIFARKAPTLETYPLFPRSVAFQEAEIARISAADPGFVALLETRLDGVDDRRYSKTHPLIYQFVRENFQPVTDLKGPPALELYVPQQAGKP